MIKQKFLVFRDVHNEPVAVDVTRVIALTSMRIRSLNLKDNNSTATNDRPFESVTVIHLDGDNSPEPGYVVRGSLDQNLTLINEHLANNQE